MNEKSQIQADRRVVPPATLGGVLDTIDAAVPERFDVHLVLDNIHPKTPVIHRGTREMESTIRAYIDQHNNQPKPFRWDKTAAEIPGQRGPLFVCGLRFAIKRKHVLPSRPLSREASQR